ncbi:hypothetical protein EZJ44_02865 [Arcanobacterium bovis]|uniref:Esterase n=2 Tax=Arcanobacterium bovis TaxID=2529275 RepID=A0A4Q9V2Q2_9ACTO|nr:hypothetical protein EZJ44_02865 [Arcanobacterium bovis]
MKPNSFMLVLSAWAIFFLCVFFAAKMLKRRKVLKFSLLSVFTSVLLCVGILAQINMHGGYMKSWSEVKEFVSGSGTVQAKPVALPPLLGNFESDVYKANFTEITDPTLKGNNFSGSFMETTWRGPQSKVEQKIRVWAPEGWQKMRDMNVIVMLHGFPSNPHLMSANLQIPSTLPALMKNSVTGPTIVVMPELRPDSREPDCVDLEGRPAVGTWVTRDVVGMINRNFPVSHDRTKWSLGGISAGGYCAGVLGAHSPEVFGNLLLLSGYDDPMFGGLKKLPPNKRSDFVISKILPKVELPMRVLASSSGNDVDAIKLLGRLAKIKAPQVQFELDYGSHGGHNWAAWSENFKDSIYWLEHKKAPNASLKTAAAEPKSKYGIVPVYLTFAAYSLLIVLAVVLFHRRQRKQLDDGYTPSKARNLGVWVLCLALALGAAVMGTLWLGSAINLKMETVQSFDDFAPLGRLIGIL